MIYTLFATPGQSAWKGDVDDPVDGKVVGQMLGDVQENILYYRIASLALDNTETSSVEITGATEWRWIIAKVVGACKIHVVTGAISTLSGASMDGYVRAYGTDVFPGFAILATLNVSQSIVVTAEADDTVVEIYTAVACDDTDARLTTNA